MNGTEYVVVMSMVGLERKWVRVEHHLLEKYAICPEKYYGMRFSTVYILRSDTVS